MSETTHDPVTTTTLAEIAEQQPAIEEWKGEKGLPKEYGTIQEKGEFWILLKRVDLPPVIVLPFREVDFTLAIHPTTKRFHIHSIAYPKAKYEREYVEKMAYLTTNCPYCVDGTNFILFPDFGKFIKQFGEMETRPLEVKHMGKLDIWAEKIGMDGTKLSFDSVVANALLSGGIGLALGNAIKSPDRWIAKLAIGGVALGLDTALGFTSWGKGIPDKVKRHLGLLGLNLIQQGLDPTPAEVRTTIADLKRAKAALMGYGPREALKQLLVPELAAKLGGLPDGPKALIPYKGMGLHYAQDVTGPVLERTTVTPLEPETKKIPPLKEVATRKTVT